MESETKRLAITQHAWSAAPSGSQDTKRYLSFAAGAKIEIVEEREAGGWWAVRPLSFTTPSHACNLCETIARA